MDVGLILGCSQALTLRGGEGPTPASPLRCGALRLPPQETVFGSLLAWLHMFGP